jgi:hypothetical protein
MKNISNFKQHGGIHVIIISIGAAVLIGIIGFFYWSNFLQTRPESKAQTTDQKNENADKKLSESKDSKTNTGDKLIISDWNVEFTLLPELQGTEVKYYQHKSTDGQFSYSFTTSRIQALGGECNKQTSGSVNFGDTIIVTRFKEKPVAVPDGELINEESINGYYYALGAPIAACSSFNENGGTGRTASEIELKDTAALRKFVKTLAKNP